MARIRLSMAITGTAIGAAAPSFIEVPNSYQGDPSVCNSGGLKTGILLSNPLIGAVTVLVDVPDEDVTNGTLDPVKVKARYPNHPLVVNGTIK